MISFVSHFSESRVRKNEKLKLKLKHVVRFSEAANEMLSFFRNPMDSDRVCLYFSVFAKVRFWVEAARNCQPKCIKSEAFGFRLLEE